MDINIIVISTTILVSYLAIFIYFYRDYVKKFLEKVTCKHEWDLYGKVNVFDEYKNPIKIRHTLICKKCGKIKKIKL